MDHQKSKRAPEKNPISVLLTMSKPLTVWITINWKILKDMGIPGGEMRLKDKLAIVTGAGSGFGAGIARRFSEEGANVIVADINDAAGERIAREVEGKFVHADVTKGNDWAKLVQAAEIG